MAICYCCLAIWRTHASLSDFCHEVNRLNKCTRQLHSLESFFKAHEKSHLSLEEGRRRGSRGKIAIHAGNGSHANLLAIFADSVSPLFIPKWGEICELVGHELQQCRERRRRRHSIIACSNDTQCEEEREGGSPGDGLLCNRS